MYHKIHLSKVHDLVLFRKFTKLQNHLHYLISSYLYNEPCALQQPPALVPSPAPGNPSCLLCLASLMEHVFKAHQCCSVYPYFFFLRLSYFIVWIDHVSWIHSSVDGQLHHFQFWAPVNNAALNIRVQVLVWIILSLQHPSVSSLGQYHLNHQGSVLHKKQDIISKAGSSGSWARVSGGLSLYLLCDLKL